MQYVRSTFGSVKNAYNSINPATLSGAIDVIVVEQEDGTLACSAFHVRFGKFQLLRPWDKKVEFVVNNVKQSFSMKLGEGGEAFFVFETTENIPAGLQTSPLASPVASPAPQPTEVTPSIEFPEPTPLDLAADTRRGRSGELEGIEKQPLLERRAQSDWDQRPVSGDWSGLPPHFGRSMTDEVLPTTKDSLTHSFDKAQSQPPEGHPHEPFDGSSSPPPVSTHDAVKRAVNLSKKLRGSNIPAQVTPSGDLMLDMTGYKSSEEDALKAEILARKILAEELEGNYDIGALIGADESGNVWIYSSEGAKDAANRKAQAADRKGSLASLNPAAMRSTDALSDPGYHSDDGQSDSNVQHLPLHTRRDSDGAVGLTSPPDSPDTNKLSREPTRNYAKTLRLSSDQLKQLNLKPGENVMSFTVNRSTCQASMYLWRHDIPIVISDIDGTITKSDALGHLFNMVGRDWTHLGVAKLYTDIASNGYNLIYLTSRSVGQADTTRGYLNGVSQDGYRLPKGAVIMSPDRTYAALRREVYLRKPEVFKMGCLRDIMSLFQSASVDANGETKTRTPFYAGFGNRLTDALSYRSVSIPPTRIFTINSNAEVSLNLLTLKSYRTSYVTMREIVDHYFPPIGTLVKEGGEDYTDFNYWRDRPLEIDEFSASESGSDGEDEPDYGPRDSVDESIRSEDEAGEGEEDLEASYFSKGSYDETGAMEDSIMESVEGLDEPPEGEGYMDDSILLEPSATRSTAELANFDDVGVEGVDEATEKLQALDLAESRSRERGPDATPLSRPVPDPQDDLRDLAKVLSSPAVAKGKKGKEKESSPEKDGFGDISSGTRDFALPKDEA
ncbi:LNS2-domain-containing protein [Tothia fuscella]|uniref:LNS2-domain-containing protein n=1 Tax=Tothia fuscella TaxID=1048955 RepID=A0A9P4P3E0_9PEZI|nr:LNS2-domain-containing protein [Tothia fuscella]